MPTFLDVINKTLQRVDEDTTNTDSQVLAVIKNGINQGYMLLASSVDKRTATVEKDYESPISLPSDFIELVRLTHDVLGRLNPIDYEENGDILYLKSRDIDGGSLVLTYYNYPASLVNDNDVVRLKDVFIGALAAYGSYHYQLYRKKYSACQLLLQEFNSYIQQPQGV